MARDDSDTTQLIERIRSLSRPLAPRPTGHPTRLLRLAGIRAVVFDVYGTLFVSGSGDIGTAKAEVDALALHRALRDVGVEGPGTPAEALLRPAIERDHAELRARGVGYPEVDIVEIWRRVVAGLQGENRGTAPTTEQLRALAVEYECLANPIWPMPGLKETLSGLSARGLAMGIVSNAQFFTPLLFPALLGADLEDLGLEPELCVWSYWLREAKPSARLFEELLARLRAHHGIVAGETLYVGNDRLNDIWPARELGLRTALFAGDARSLRLREDDARCQDAEPDVVIDDLRQLLQIVA
jgi:putative hydrolase of the HAD superfamily